MTIIIRPSMSSSSQHHGYLHDNICTSWLTSFQKKRFVLDWIGAKEGEHALRLEAANKCNSVQIPCNRIPGQSE